MQLTTSTYLLPDLPAQHEQFQWLAKEIRDSGGDSTLVRAQEIEGMSRDKSRSRSLTRVRDADYAALKKTLQPLLARQRNSDADAAAAELERLTRQFRELREIDFFESPRGHEVAMLLQRLEQTPRQALPRLNRKDYRGKSWQTRPRPEIDRAGSAWLIRKFIDPEAKLRLFASKLPSRSEPHPVRHGGRGVLPPWRLPAPSKL